MATEGELLTGDAQRDVWRHCGSGLGLDPLVRIDNLFSAAAFIRDRLAGRVPDNWQELVAIPGVGTTSHRLCCVSHLTVPVSS